MDDESKISEEKIKAANEALVHFSNFAAEAKPFVKIALNLISGVKDLAERLHLLREARTMLIDLGLRLEALRVCERIEEVHRFLDESNGEVNKKDAAKDKLVKAKVYLSMILTSLPDISNLAKDQARKFLLEARRLANEHQSDTGEDMEYLHKEINPLLADLSK